MLVVAACSPARRPQKVGAQPSWRMRPSANVPVGPVTFAPSSQPVTRYNEPVRTPTSSELGDATVAAVREAAMRAGTAVPIADERLFRACAELAEVVPEEGIISYS